MFKHILLPTDGSPLSDTAVEKGLQLAKSVGARVSGIHVRPPFHVFTIRTEMLEDTREEFEHDTAARATAFLSALSARAAELGVACDTISVTSDHPYEAILEAAEEKGCDLILMGSHGRRGLEAVFVGSETQKVVTHGHVPVLVCR